MLKNLLVYGDKQGARANIEKAILAQKLEQAEPLVLLDFSGEVFEWAESLGT